MRTVRAILSRFAKLLIFSSIFLVIGVADIFASDWKLLKDVDGQKVKLRVNDKTRYYWKLQRQDTISVKVIGPASLKAYCRAAIPSKQSEVLFGLLSVMDGGKRELVGSGSTYDKTVKYPKLSKQRISQARRFIFDIPHGEHELQFMLPPSVKKTVYMRLLVSTKSEDEKSWIAYLPRRFQDEVRLIIKEREYIYYRSDNNNPIELEVIGPTRIRVIARLEFDHSIRGDKSYRIQVKEDKMVLSTQPIMATVSATAKYPNPSDKIPARGENFYIDVPSGKHLLEIFTPDTGISILLRFYIPQKDLENKTSSGLNGRAGILKFLRVNNTG